MSEAGRRKKKKKKKIKRLGTTKDLDLSFHSLVFIYIFSLWVCIIEHTTE